MISILRLAVWISLIPLSGIAQVGSISSPISVNRGSWRSVIMPNDDVRLSAQAEGLIVAYPHKEGDRVKKGDILVEMDDRAEKVQLANAEAALRRAVAEKIKAEKDFERIKSLYDEHIASDKQFLEATYALEQAQAGFSQAQQAVEMASLQLSYRTIRSPIDGIFFKKIKSVGEVLQRLEVAARVIDDSSLDMMVYVSPQYFGLFQIGDRVDIQLLDGPHMGKIVEALVDYVDPLIDPASGTFRVKLLVEPSMDVYSGLGALLLIDTLRDLNGNKKALQIHDELSTH